MLVTIIMNTIVIVVVTVDFATSTVVLMTVIVNMSFVVVSVAIMVSCRDDVHHHGRRIDWGSWAVCRDDWHFGGTGALKTGASYHPAPGKQHLGRLKCRSQEMQGHGLLP